jgi:ribose/xylose/arabinose/galactoside ABC-type transport system permease subunit
MNPPADDRRSPIPNRWASWRSVAGRALTTGGPFAGLLLAVVFFSYLTREEGTFLTEFNIRTIAVQSVIVGLSALGMTLVIVSAGIDLSVGSQVALVTVVTALLGRDQDLSPFVCVLGGVVVGTMCGLLNGLAIDRLKLMPFIVTLGTLQVYRGLAKLLAKNTAVYFPGEAKPAWLSEIMAIEPGPKLKEFAATLPSPLEKPVLAVPPAGWLLILMALIVWIALRKTTWGRYVVAVGSNEATARLCGLRVGFLKVSVYTFCGFLTGLAGMMQFAEMNGTGDPVVASGLELEVIAAVVIGGGSLAGGEASVIGTLVGALVMRVLRSGCVHAGIPNATQDILIGAIIVSAVALDKFRTSLASRRSG